MFITTCSLLVFIRDYTRYAAQQDEIDKWAFTTFNYQPRTGMILKFQNEKDMVLFLLRWS